MANSKGIGGGEPGNKRGLKLKDPDVRQEAFKQYCDHLASGYPKEAFYFDHPIHSVTWETMDKYIEENPTEFPSDLVRRAKSARYKHWLDEGNLLMKGKYRNGSPVVWQTIMRNIFKAEGWDANTKETPKPSEQVHFAIAEAKKLDQENG